MRECDPSVDHVDRALLVVVGSIQQGIGDLHRVSSADQRDADDAGCRVSIGAAGTLLCNSDPMLCPIRIPLVTPAASSNDDNQVRHVLDGRQRRPLAAAVSRQIDC